MSYLKDRKKTLKSLNSNKEIIRHNSRVRIDQNILNYLTKINEKGKLKKISSLNESKEKKISTNTYNVLNENMYYDSERKNKARRSLLYLLNKMSGGTFCPQIIDYFKEIRELEKQKEKLKEVREEEENNKDQVLINIVEPKRRSFIKGKTDIISDFNKQRLVGHGKNSYPNYKFTKRNEKNNINEEKNIMSKHYAKDFGLEDLEKFIDSEEIEKMNGNKFNFNKEAQAKKKFLEEITIDEDDRYYLKKAKKNEKKKYKENNEYINVEENIDNLNEGNENLKKVAFPSLERINRLNRMNTISGGVTKEKNFINDKNNFTSNYNVSTKIKEEKIDKSSLNFKKYRKNYI